MTARLYRIYGRVQGVGFRFFTQNEGRRLGLTGWVRNLADGSVEAEASGDDKALGRFSQALARGPGGSRVDRVEEAPAHEDTEYEDFKIRY